MTKTKPGTASGEPAIAHAVRGFDGGEGGVEGEELPADALDVRGDRVVVEHDVRGVHELLAILHVAGETRQRVHEPELRHRERYRLIVPERSHAIRIETQGAALQRLVRRLALRQRIDATEQR